jgi:hypothetical protein
MVIVFFSLPLTLAIRLFKRHNSSCRRYCSCSTVHPSHGTVHSPPVLCPMRSPCRTTPRLLPSMLDSRPLSRRPRSRPPLPVTVSRPPPWSRRLQLPVSVCHLRLHRRLPRPRPRSSSPPPLQPTKTRSSPDFTFRRPQCSTSSNW